MAASAVLLARLALAWRRLAHLRHRAVRAESATIQACHELASQFGVSAPEVLRNPLLPSPCLAGLRRPAILLSDSELSLSVRDVLIHEPAHLRRRDCHWNLIRQFATAMFFFQPLLWRLSRRLETVAEEVCDDYVVQFGGDRRVYAHQLVDIVELSNTSVAAAGVGIVSLRSMLAKRVTRIMDTSCSLSTRVSPLLLTIVLVSGLVGTTIVGLVGVRPESSLADAESKLGEVAATSDEETDDESTTHDSEAAVVTDVIEAKRTGPRIWYILSQTDTDGLLHGMPQRLGKVILPSRWFGRMCIKWLSSQFPCIASTSCLASCFSLGVKAFFIRRTGRSGLYFLFSGIGSVANVRAMSLRADILLKYVLSIF